MRKKCIVIGSGLGGLTCGLILSRNGYDVTILEQGTQVGGCLQCFTRHDLKFETGMHFIGSADEGQVLYRFLNYFGVLDDMQLSRLDPTGYDVVSFEGQRFRLANGRERFIETLAADFPKERDSLNRYFDLIEQIASASSLHNLRRAEDDVSPFVSSYQLRSISEVLDEVIADPLLRSVLAGNIPLYGAERGKTPFSVHAFITDTHFSIMEVDSNIMSIILKMFFF